MPYCIFQNKSWTRTNMEQINWVLLTDRSRPTIACSQTSSQSLIFSCRLWSSAFKCSSDFRKISLHLNSATDRPLIDPQSIWSSAAKCKLICIVDPRYIAHSLLPTRSLFFCCFHWYSTFKSYSDFRKIPCTCTPQVIHLWLILNHHGLLLLIVNWFVYLNTYLSLTPASPVSGLLLLPLIRTSVHFLDLHH